MASGESLSEGDSTSSGDVGAEGDVESWIIRAREAEYVFFLSCFCFFGLLFFPPPFGILNFSLPVIALCQGFIAL